MGAGKNDSHFISLGRLKFIKQFTVGVFSLNSTVILTNKKQDVKIKSKTSNPFRS